MQFYHTYLSLDEWISARISSRISVHKRRRKTEEKDGKQRRSEYLLSCLSILVDACLALGFSSKTPQCSCSDEQQVSTTSLLKSFYEPIFPTVLRIYISAWKQPTFWPLLSLCHIFCNAIMNIKHEFLERNFFFPHDPCNVLLCYFHSSYMCLNIPWITFMTSNKIWSPINPSPW